jgi:hypothetical protein
MDKKLDLKEILSISGQSGLFRYIAPGSHGVIVESLTDGRRTNAAGTAKISTLGEISVYTASEDLPLWKIFQALHTHTSGSESIDPKSDSALLKKLFAEVVPGYDRDRVHVSDMKKIVGWYNILVGAGMSDFEPKEKEKEEEAG